MWYEILGYAASVLVAISLMTKSILRLRVVNLVGALCFTAYGMLIHAYPVAAVNFVIVLINVYHLRQIAAAREFFKIVQVAPGSEYLAVFLDYHRQEIERFLPEFDFRPREGDLNVFVLRDMVPAGLFIASPDGPATLMVRLDFVIAGYRDLKVAEFVFKENAGLFRSRGVKTLVSPPGGPDHEPYLERVGFRAEGTGPERRYRLEL